MATLKWKNNKYWETFFYGAFENIKADLKNIIIAINRLAAATRRRCCRDKNLSDIYSASEGRKNLQLILDCSDASRLGSTTHHHDSRYMPYINDLLRRMSSAESTLSDHESRIAALEAAAAAAEDDGGGESGGGGGSSSRVFIASTDFCGDMYSDGYFWMGWGVFDSGKIINEFIDNHTSARGSKYEISVEVVGTVSCSGGGTSKARACACNANGSSWSSQDAWNKGKNEVTLHSGQNKFGCKGTITLHSGSSNDHFYIGGISPAGAWGNTIHYQANGSNMSVYMTSLKIDGKQVDIF